MTRTQALATARSRVSMEPLGNQWTVYTWSPKHNATWTSPGMDYWHARNAVWENRVCVALELLGIENAGERAYRAAHDADYRDIGGWQKAVRLIANTHALKEPVT